MYKSEKCSGVTYLSKNTQVWSGCCPYNLRHCIMLTKNGHGLQNWQQSTRFDKWHQIGQRVKTRYNAKPYKLFWRTSYHALYK